MESQRGINERLTNDISNNTINNYAMPPIPTIRVSIELIKREREQEVIECCICYNSEVALEEVVKLNCEHSFCKTCICKHIDRHQREHSSHNCPCCRAEIKKLTVDNGESFNELTTKYCLTDEMLYNYSYSYSYPYPY